MPSLQTPPNAPPTACQEAAPTPPQAALPADFWLTGPPPALLWQTAGAGALRIAYARPLAGMLS